MTPASARSSKIRSSCSLNKSRRSRRFLFCLGRGNITYKCGHNNVNSALKKNEEVGPAFPTSTPLVRAARRPQLSTPHASGGQCALGHGAGKGPQVLCAVPRVMTVRSLAVGHWFPSGCHLCVCVCSCTCAG